MLREGLAQLSFLESEKSVLRGLIPHWRLSAMGAFPVGDTLDILSLEIQTMDILSLEIQTMPRFPELHPPAMAAKMQAE